MEVKQSYKGKYVGSADDRDIRPRGRDRSGQPFWDLWVRTMKLWML